MEVINMLIKVGTQIVDDGTHIATFPTSYYPPVDYDDHCDCDERCRKCGKKKKRRGYPWYPKEPLYC